MGEKIGPCKDITAIVSEISSLIEKNEIDLHDACLTDDSSEVAVVVAGYIAKKLKERSKCLVCKLGLFNMEIKAISIFFHVVG